MPTAYSYSESNHATDVPVIFTGGLGDTKCCRLTYYVKVRQPAEAGSLTFVFRWKDRDGSLQELVSAPLALDGTGRIGDVVPFYTENAEGAGAFIQFELVTVDLLGAGAYDFFMEVDEATYGN